MKSTRTSSITDQTVKHNPKQDLSSDLTDVSIISVGLTRYPHHNHRMLTDDEEDIEVSISKKKRIRIIFELYHSRMKQVMKKKMQMTMMKFHRHLFLIHIYP